MAKQEENDAVSFNKGRPFTSWRLACLWLSSLLACQAPDHSRFEVADEDSAGIHLTTLTGAPQALPRWDLGDVTLKISGSPPDDSDAPYLESVSQAFLLSDGEVLLVDMRGDRIHVFDSLGVHQITMGGPGEGPAEFSWIRNVTVTSEDSIFAYDPHLRAMKVFHPNVGFVRSFRLPDPQGGAGTGEVWRIAHDRFVHLHYEYSGGLQDLPSAVENLAYGEARRLDRDAIIHLLDPERVISSALVFKGGFGGIVGQVGDVLPPFSPRPFLCVTPGQIFFGPGSPFSLIRFDDSFSNRWELRWPSFEEDLDPREVESLHKRLSGRAISQLQKDLFSAMFSRDLLPARRPAIQQVLVDPLARIWVARFDTPYTQDQRRTWYVMDSDGRPLGQLRIPGEQPTRLMAVGEDRALVVRRDEFDVPNVEVRMLIPPPVDRVQRR